jgi:hypothetical protein
MTPCSICSLGRLLASFRYSSFVKTIDFPADGMEAEPIVLSMSTASGIESEKSIMIGETGYSIAYLHGPLSGRLEPKQETGSW